MNGQRARAPRCKAFALHQGKQLRCILDEGHERADPLLQGHELAPVDASADQLRPVASSSRTRWAMQCDNALEPHRWPLFEAPTFATRCPACGATATALASESVVGPAPKDGAA